MFLACCSDWLQQKEPFLSDFLTAGFRVGVLASEVY